MKKDKGHSSPHDDSRDQYKRHVDGDITVRGQLEVYPPPDIAKADDTDRENQASYRKKNYIVSVVTLVAVAIYAGLTWWQGCSTKKSADAAQASAEVARNALVASNRPWVGVVSPVSITSIEHNDITSTATYVVTLKNYGPGVASNIWVYSSVVADIKDLSSTIEMQCSLAHSVSAGLGETMFPGEAYGKWYRNVTFKRTGMVFVVGCISYHDQFGKLRTTRFCNVLNGADIRKEKTPIALYSFFGLNAAD